MQIQEARPPYVQFETRAEVDRNASEQQGHVVYKNVDYALITPSGSKDCVEKIAAEWIEQITRQAISGTYPSQWAEHYKNLYKQWREGNEMPDQGTPLKKWPVLTPAEIAQLEYNQIRTVEQLYELPDSALQMGWRALRDKARAWIDGAKDQGRMAEKVSALEAASRLKDEQIENLLAKVNELESAVSALNPERRGPGRPRKELTQ